MGGAVGAEWLDRLAELRMATLAGGQRAWHKPFLLLVALRRLDDGEPRLAAKREITRDVGRLLDRFQPAGTSGISRADAPWTYLPNDGLWETSGGTTKDTGGLPERFFSELAADRGLAHLSISLLVHAYLPESIHTEVLRDVGLTTGIASPETVALAAPERAASVVSRFVRDPVFVSEVMEAYSATCVVCRYDGRAGDRYIGLEAAHIRALCDGGPDVPANGWAMCVLHHRLFDVGMFSVRPDDLVVVASPRFSARSAHPLRAYVGEPVAVPAGVPLDREALAFHSTAVFRAAS